MLSREGRQYMEMAPRLAMWSGGGLTLVVYCLNMVGDALRDLRLRGGGRRWNQEASATGYRDRQGPLAGLQAEQAAGEVRSMSLTRNFKEPIRARMERDPAFREELLKEGVDCLLPGDMDTGKALLRDYINATVAPRLAIWPGLCLTTVVYRINRFRCVVPCSGVHFAAAVACRNCVQRVRRVLSDVIGTRRLALMAGDLNGELRGFVERWRIAGARLAALRRSQLRDVEVADHIESLNGAFEATLAGPVRTTSGLVQQQAMFARIRDARPLSSGE